MAFCINCGKDIGGGSAPCDACGKKRPSAVAPLVGGIIVGATAVLWIGALVRDESTRPAEPVAAQTRPAASTVEAPAPKAAQAPVPAPTPEPATPSPPPEPPAGAQWRYSVDEDPMSSAKSYFATVVSTNEVEFGFPYGGSQNGYLTLRTHPRYGKNVIFRIERGQILCPSYEGCTVLVRFDEEPAVKFSANGAADNSTETLFLDNYSRFAEKLLKARRVRISPEIYQQGSPVFEFDVSGFDVKKYRPE